jgi:RNA polymerase sigma-70 factor (ECF subfamily)
VDGNSAIDAKQLEKARRGNEPAFLELYHRYRTSVFQFAWRLTGSQASAEDITQECFLALLEGADYDPTRGALRTYLLGIARHRAMRRLRLIDRESDEAEYDSVSDESTDQLGVVLQAERAERIGRAIAALPLAQREALVLFEYEELSLEEIAQMTGVEPGAVKARLFRARETLRKRLAPLMAVSSARSSS